ncbi:MAG: NUDIX hydrolase [Candidatus Magasanikbacteria bacterium]|nr:NUDIX hydrolase [Candidatus Magasanikbacteria bacterium]
MDRLAGRQWFKINSFNMISLSTIENFNKKFDVVSLFIIYNGKILLLKRQSDKHFAGTWGPPAGKGDEGEDLEQAICRETFEETGIVISPEEITKDEKHYFVRHGDIDFMFHVYSVVLEKESNVVLRDIEHSGFAWFTPAEALKLDLVQDEEVPISDFFLSQ